MGLAKRGTCGGGGTGGGGTGGKATGATLGDDWFTKHSAHVSAPPSPGSVQMLQSGCWHTEQ